MKIKLIIAALLATTIGTASAGRQREMAASIDNTLKPIEIACPGFITVGPVNLQGVWESTSVFPENVLGMEIQLAGAYTKQQMVKCWYGDGKNILVLTHKVPAGYSCKTSPTSKLTALCKVLWK